MFIIHINVINKVSEFYQQQVVIRSMIGRGKGNDESMVSDKNEGKSEQVFIIVFISLVLIIVVS